MNRKSLQEGAPSTGNLEFNQGATPKNVISMQLNTKYMSFCSYLI